MAQLLLSIFLGFVAQRSLTGDVDAQAHADALAALAYRPPPPARHATSTQPAETDAAGR